MEDTMALASGRHVFVSYASPYKLPAISKVCSTFALDNGAFSAWRSETTFDWSGYEDFVREWHRHPACDWHVIPDVIDGTEKENDDLIARWPKELGGVPVWHLHESIDRLERLAGDFHRVAVGSSGQFSKVGTMPWWTRMDEVMQRICDSRGRPRVKLHGMRMLNWRIFSRLPLASADSTNAEQNGQLDKGEMVPLLICRQPGGKEPGSWRLTVPWQMKPVSYRGTLR